MAEQYLIAATDTSTYLAFGGKWVEDPQQAVCFKSLNRANLISDIIKAPTKVIPHSEAPKGGSKLDIR